MISLHIGSTVRTPSGTEFEVEDLRILDNNIDHINGEHTLALQLLLTRQIDKAVVKTVDNPKEEQTNDE